ncbi:PREDICTED: tumor necrosis factor receptor superfamily member 23-like [Sturnus vulgaris]|uniref:tumor necrosis factor receptor superfamily member 23-like n=1 Tax=Sturnus vulgaris TaxID=9172 RepID=UPI00071A25EE|nr:PREDICTED: tumor necrosis factor receptor superfamily member 23-like [Sturnus vulgaris]
MASTMGAGRALGLLLQVVLLTMPGAQASCGESEYSHEDLCCVLCEAGTFVADHCSASHLRGKCDPCKEGKGFTAHANGLEGCVPCRQCKEDQITLSPCTRTRDAECQCKQGYSCADEACEICERNSPRHPGGKEILQNSTDAMDTGVPNQGRSPLVWIFVALSVLFLLIVLLAVLKKLKRDKAALTDKVAEGDLVRKWLKYVTQPGFFVGLCSPSRPGQICSTSSVCRS